jgi:predicted transcriptional regulator
MNLDNSDFKEHKALANPLRLSMLPHFENPRTVKQAADEMGIRPHTLYHHIRVLEKCGIVELVRTEKLNGSIEEKYFQLTPKYRREGVHKKSNADDSQSALEATMEILREYQLYAETNADVPCHNCVKRVIISSKDRAQIQDSLENCIEQMYEQHIKPFETSDGDATFVLNAFGFIK